MLTDHCRRQLPTNPRCSSPRRVRRCCACWEKDFRATAQVFFPLGGTADFRRSGANRAKVFFGDLRTISLAFPRVPGPLDDKQTGTLLAPFRVVVQRGLEHAGLEPGSDNFLGLLLGERRDKFLNHRPPGAVFFGLRRGVVTPARRTANSPTATFPRSLTFASLKYRGVV